MIVLGAWYMLDLFRRPDLVQAAMDAALPVLIETMTAEPTRWAVHHNLLHVWPTNNATRTPQQLAANKSKGAQAVEQNTDQATNPPLAHTLHDLIY